MSRTMKRYLIITGIFALILFIGVSSSVAEHESTSECGPICHNISSSFTMSSNSTGNATIGIPFTLSISAQKGTPGQPSFWLSVQAGWADNNKFNFTPAYIQDGGTGDTNPVTLQITHDFTFTPIIAGNYTIRAWCAAGGAIPGASQFLDISIFIPVVPDETPPIIDSPSDIAYVLPTTGHNIIWTPTDEFPSQFNIRMNETVVLSGGWNGQPITINVDYLSPGIYVYNLTVIDVSGNAVSDVVIVTVTGEITIPPTTTIPTTTTGTTSTTVPTTSGGNPGVPEDNNKALVTETFSLIMVSTGIIVGVLIFLLILDRWRPWN